MAGDLAARSKRTSVTDKAKYHQVLGAGSKRVLRKFLGLAPADLDWLQGVIADRVGANLVNASLFGQGQHSSSLGVSIDTNFAPLSETVWLTKADWLVIARQARDRILLRTAQGRDQDGNVFQSYSPEYAAARAKDGYSSTPNLSLSGEMLKALVFEADADGAVLFISG